jgi:hypothetical protein
MLSRTFFIYAGNGDTGMWRCTTIEDGSATRAIIATLRNLEEDDKDSVNYTYETVCAMSSNKFLAAGKGVKLDDAAVKKGMSVNNMLVNISVPGDSNDWVWLQFPSQGDGAQQWLKQVKTEYFKTKKEKAEEKKKKDLAKEKEDMENALRELEGSGFSGMMRKNNK